MKPTSLEGHAAGRHRVLTGQKRGGPVVGHRRMEQRLVIGRLGCVGAHGQSVPYNSPASSSRRTSTARSRTAGQVGQLLRRAHLAGDPRVLHEPIVVAGEEVPVERGERAGVVAGALLAVESARLAVVAHLVDVVAAGGVRLGGHLAAVGPLAHADHVRQHHPLGAVDEVRPHPVGHRPRVDAVQHRQVAEHHQPLDVVVVGLVVERGDAVAPRSSSRSPQRR